MIYKNKETGQEIEGVLKPNPFDPQGKKFILSWAVPMKQDQDWIKFEDEYFSDQEEFNQKYLCKNNFMKEFFKKLKTWLKQSFCEHNCRTTKTEFTATSAISKTTCDICGKGVAFKGDPQALTNHFYQNMRMKANTLESDTK